MRKKHYKIVWPLVVGVFCLASTIASASQVILSNLTIEDIAVDTTGPNKFIHVSPAQTGCYAVGSSVLLFNDVGENANMAYSTLLTAFAAGKK